jgi:hypothetical protein
VLTGDPVAGAQVLAAHDANREELENFTDHELLERATRELCIAIRLVCRELAHHASMLVVEKTMETAVLLMAMAHAIKAAGSAYSQVIIMREHAKRQNGHQRMDDSDIDGLPSAHK